MNFRLIIAGCFAAGLVAASGFAGSFQVREVGGHVWPMEEGNADASRTFGSEPDRPIALISPLVTSGPAIQPIYPVAGVIGMDVFIPYYLDLDGTDNVRDFDCGRHAFGGHEGHDPYIRSFAEQDIGVPVFTPLDGVVRSVRDGQPDRNTTTEGEFGSNSVIIDHGNQLETRYVHLRQGIPVVEGQIVSAGTQIGLVGSSGPSTGPHIHFETRYHGEPVELFAGSCRPGASFSAAQPDSIARGLFVMDVALSETSPGGLPPAPHDELPRTGMFPLGISSFFLQVDLGNVPSGTDYELVLERPNGSTIDLGEGMILAGVSARRATVWWNIQGALNSTGTWTLHVNFNGGRAVSVPFEVVSSRGQVQNRPPGNVSVRVEPSGIRPGEVAQCVAEGARVGLDPDYDVVRFDYRWLVDGEPVREFTSAARSDVLSSVHVRAGTRLRCEVTVRDASASSSMMADEIDVEMPSRLRGARR